MCERIQSAREYICGNKTHEVMGLLQWVFPQRIIHWENIGLNRHLFIQTKQTELLINCTFLNNNQSR